MEKDLFLITQDGSPFFVTNIKLRFKEPIKIDLPIKQLMTELQERGAHDLKRRNNLLIFRFRDFCYTLLTSGHLNITGIKTEHQVLLAIRSLSELLPRALEKPVESIILTLDNITASGRLSQRPIAHFSKVMRTFCQKHNLSDSAHFSPELFSGYSIKTDYGTLVFFQTGSINIFGVRHFCDAEFHRSLINSFIREVNIQSHGKESSWVQ